MKKAVKAVTLGILLSFSIPKAISATSKYHCNNLLFYAMDVTHKKEVRVCMSGKDLVYTFGKMNVDKPELELKQPTSKTEFAYDIDDEENKFGGTLSIIHYDHIYTIRGLASKVYPLPNKGLLAVWKNEDNIAEIPLDPVTIIDNIKQNVEMYNIPVLEYD